MWTNSQLGGPDEPSEAKMAKDEAAKDEQPSEALRSAGGFTAPRTLGTAARTDKVVYLCHIYPFGQYSRKYTSFNGNWYNYMVPKEALERKAFDNWMCNLPGELAFTLQTAYDDATLFGMWQTCQIGNYLYENNMSSYGPVPTTFDPITQAPMRSDDSATTTRMATFSRK